MISLEASCSIALASLGDSTGELWQKGELEDKPAGIFTSTATIHGGQESTILTSLVPLLHLGMIFVATPYGQNPQILTTEGIGGFPYGPSTLAGTDGSRQPVEDKLKTARNLGKRVARIAGRLKKSCRPALRSSAYRDGGQAPSSCRSSTICPRW